MSTARRHLMLGTAGHVDHGKTALVKLLTGCETDTLAEEKQRGLTIDLGFAPCRLADERVVGIVDVPGHVDFIRHMVAGAHGIDVVLFVVAADDGIMPQTLEHLHILTFMGLRHGVVVLTKVDLVDAARREFVVRELRRLLANTFLAQAPICPVSNLTGEGFEAFFDALNRVVAACADRPAQGWFRLWVEDVFTIRGAGTVITGIPQRGRVRVGDHLHLLPGDTAGRVRRLQVYGEDATEGCAGECVALNVPELDHTVARRGHVLSAAPWPEPVTMAEAEFHALDDLPEKLEDNLEVQLHVGTAAVQARVAMLEVPEMAAGHRQWVQLRLAEPLSLAPGERFVARANLGQAGRGGLATVGGGRIVGLSNTRLRRRKPWTLAALAARRDALDDPARWCEVLVRQSQAPVSAADLQRLALLTPDELASLLGRLREAGRLQVTPSGLWVHCEAVEQAAAVLRSDLQAFHAAHPQRAGADREALLAATKLSAELLDLAIARLLESAQAVRCGEVLALAGWQPQVPDSDLRLMEALERRLQQAGVAPPTVDEWPEVLGLAPAQTSKLLRLLADRGRAVRLDEKLWLHPDAVEAAKEVALRLFRRAPTFTTMDFRDALGVSRKFAVPLLDHLDKLRFTVRSGHLRAPGVEARKRLAPSGAASGGKTS